MAWTPYAALLLADAGLADATISAILALFPLAYVIAGPGWAIVADATGAGVGLLRVATLGTLLGTIGFALAPSPAWMGLLLFVTAFCRAPQFPMVDALTVRVLPNGREGYGRVRLWGSLTWLILAFVGGFLREAEPRLILWVGVLALGGTVAATLSLPTTSASAPTRPAPGALLKHRVLGPLLLATWLHGAAITSYDSLFSLHVERCGFPAHFVGIGIAVGVGAEIAALAAAPWLLTRFAPGTLLLGSAVLAFPRWWLTGTAEDPWTLALSQALHGANFGVFWLAGVALNQRVAPAGLATTAQATFHAAMFGTGALTSMGFATLWLREGTTRGLFLALSGFSALAVLTLLLVRAREREEDR